MIRRLLMAALMVVALGGFQAYAEQPPTTFGDELRILADPAKAETAAKAAAEQEIRKAGEDYAVESLDYYQHVAKKAARTGAHEAIFDARGARMNGVALYGDDAQRIFWRGFEAKMRHLLTGVDFQMVEDCTASSSTKKCGNWAFIMKW